MSSDKMFICACQYCKNVRYPFAYHSNRERNLVTVALHDSKTGLGIDFAETIQRHLYEKRWGYELSKLNAFSVEWNGEQWVKRKVDEYVTNLS